MNDADADFELRRLFLGFGGAIALFVLLYVGRSLKVYFMGRRVRAVIVKVLKKEPDPLLTRSRPTYSYVLEYVGRDGERCVLHERQDLSVQEFEVGDTVTAYVQSDRIAEILSWRRIALSISLIAFTAGAMIAAYYVLLGRKG